MGKWESKMTAGERRGLATRLVAAANDEASKTDKFCVSCFTRTGGLVHWTKSEIDKLIKPQGVTSNVVTTRNACAGCSS